MTVMTLMKLAIDVAKTEWKLRIDVQIYAHFFGARGRFRNDLVEDVAM